MNHVKDRFGDSVPEEVLLLCLGITSGVGRLVFGRVADYIPGAKKIYLQVCLYCFSIPSELCIPKDLVSDTINKQAELTDWRFTFEKFQNSRKLSVWVLILGAFDAKFINL